MVPQSLRRWFVIHFWVDIVFALPLLAFPIETLQLFGWVQVDPITTRLVGAALFAIGVESLLSSKAHLESIQTLLRFKILWSLAANFALIASLIQGAPKITWLFEAIFFFFSCLWIYYKKNLKIGATDGVE